MSHRHPASRTYTLSAGESRTIRVAAGSRWFAARGAVRLIEPSRWLGERIVRVEQTLPDGAVHRVERAGWVTLHALADAVLICSSPAGVAAALLGAAWRIIRSVRRAHAPA
ncbi:MAG: hypothetical protein ABUL50_00890 [Rhizobacter sp.]